MSRPLDCLGFFISAHGYGHATRAAAVMQALRQQHPRLALHVYSDPRIEFLLQSSVPGGVIFHPAWVDVGVVQSTPFDEDLAATCTTLERQWADAEQAWPRWAADLRQAGCQAIVCDISPWGLRVAQALKIPGILQGNFRWDWIYEGYLAREPRLADWVARFASAYELASLSIGTTPVCDPPHWQQQVAPVARPPRLTRAAARHRLGALPNERLVLVTLGGIPWQLEHLPTLPAGIKVLVPAPQSDIRQGFHLIGADQGWHHPDLVLAADAVIGKAGYSTLAEVHQAGVPFGFIPRHGFRESQIMAEFIQHHMRGMVIAESALRSGQWVETLETLLVQNHLRWPEPESSSGAISIANNIWQLVAAHAE